MDELTIFTCIDCGASGSQQSRGRARLRCDSCGRIHRAAQESQRARPERGLALPERRCEGCNGDYAPRTRAQRWCSKRCNDRHRAASRPPAKLSPEARERQRLYWQAKNRRRRAAKRGGKSEPYSLAEIAERDGWLCKLCGEAVPASAKVPDRLAPTIDHIVALSRGGDDTRGNVQLAHFRCNSMKGPRPVLSVVPAGGVRGD